MKTTLNGHDEKQNAGRIDEDHKKESSLIKIMVFDKNGKCN